MSWRDAESLYRGNITLRLSIYIYIYLRSHDSALLLIRIHVVAFPDILISD